MTTAEGLRAARALYAANPSHCPADEFPPYGSHCPVSAMTNVELGVLGCGLYSAMSNAFHAAIGNTTTIPTWNASHSTPEVLALWDTAIEIAEAS